MASWADPIIGKLQKDGNVTFRPRGNSMTPKINSGDLVTLIALYGGEPLNVGDIVLCSVGGRHYLHLVSAIQGDRVQISNNHGHVNGWTHRSNLYGTLVKVER